MSSADSSWQSKTRLTQTASRCQSCCLAAGQERLKKTKVPLETQLTDNKTVKVLKISTGSAWLISIVVWFTFLSPLMSQRSCLWQEQMINHIFITEAGLSRVTYLHHPFQSRLFPGAPVDDDSLFRSAGLTTQMQKSEKQSVKIVDCDWLQLIMEQ